MKKIILDDDVRLKLRSEIVEKIYPLVLEKLKKDEIEMCGQVRGDINEDFVSLEMLLNIMNTHEDIPVSRSGKKKTLIPLSDQYASANIIDSYIEKLYPEYAVRRSGFFLYPKNGYMSWHTNSDEPCKRVYVAFADENMKSYFRYFDPNKKEIVTDYDINDVNIREFEITGKYPFFWHAVYSKCNRISIGYRLFDKKDD